MPRLAERYQSVLSHGNAETTDCAALESAIARLYVQGRAGHPDLSVDDLMFARHLARCRAPINGHADGLHAADLFLACGAVAGDERAVFRLHKEYWPIVVRYVRHIASGPLDDLAQTLWETLLVGDITRPGTLTLYAGIGSLAGFVGITAQRMALRKVHRDDLAARTARRAAAEINAITRDSDLELMRLRYRDEFERAVRTALDLLDDRQRMILRMRVVDGLTVARIASVYQVAQATVSRWLDSTRIQIRENVRRSLGEHLSLTESEFEGFVGLMVSQLDISISKVLGA